MYGTTPWPAKAEVFTIRPIGLRIQSIWLFQTWPTGLCASVLQESAPPPQNTVLFCTGPHCRLFVENLYRALQCDQQRLAFAVQCFASGNLDPAFTDAVLLHIKTFFRVEADANVVFKHGRHMVGAAGVDGQVVGQGGGGRSWRAQAVRRSLGCSSGSPCQGAWTPRALATRRPDFKPSSWKP